MAPSTLTLLIIFILAPLAFANPIPTPSSPPQPPEQYSLSALAWPLLIYDVFSLVALLWAWRRGFFSNADREYGDDDDDEGTRERWERWAREEEVMRRLGVLG